MMVNRVNVRKVATAIEGKQFPTLGFNMLDFAAKPKHWGPHQIDHMEKPRCGTVACIAGWTKRVRTNKPLRKAETYEFDWESEGEWLGLGYDLAHELFFAENIEFGSTTLSDITPSQAVRCLRHLARTGKVDWAKATEKA